MTVPRQTPLHHRHVALGAKMVEFGGWDMPLMYPTGVVAEHLATRRGAGLFDVSHMGRFSIGGADALHFLQGVLSNNAAALDVGQAQYTFIPSETGGAIDDAYLYRFVEDEYLLVVNASNRERDWDHLHKEAQTLRARGDMVDLVDQTEHLIMLSLQGPQSRAILAQLLESGSLPDSRRNELSVVTIAGVQVCLSRTGYTGEPLCFELLAASEHGPVLWDLLAEKGAVPCGLGARDTLRLEAALPLYGHEIGYDPEGREIPLMSSPLALFAVSFSPVKGDFVGRDRLARQHTAYQRILSNDYSLVADLSRISDGGRYRAGRGPGGVAGVEGRALCWLGHQRHHGALLEDGGGRP
jgi:aminomethyltransferase